MSQAGDLSLFRTRPLRRLEFERLVELGSFGDERLELLYGRLVEMSPQGRAHAFVIQRLTMLLASRLAGRAEVRVQLPLAVSEISEPEPDVAIVPNGDYLDEHPNTGLVVIEVADTSLATDRRVKRPLYAQAAFPEYWLVNLVDGVVEVHDELGGGEYQRVRRFQRGETLIVPGFPDISVPVAEVLPPE